MKRSRRLTESLRAESPLRQQVVPGVDALKKKDRQLLAEAARQTIVESLDLDTAMATTHPDSHRWDYLVAVSPSKAPLVAVEPHSARESEVSVVVQKKRNTEKFLRGHLNQTSNVSRWVWVASGRVDFLKTEKVRRNLDQQGIEFAGRSLKSLA
jgi:hypothetical protein